MTRLCLPQPAKGFAAEVAVRRFIFKPKRFKYNQEVAIYCIWVGFWISLYFKVISLPCNPNSLSSPLEVIKYIYITNDWKHAFFLKAWLEMTMLAWKSMVRKRMQHYGIIHQTSLFPCCITGRTAHLCYVSILEPCVSWFIKKEMRECEKESVIERENETERNTERATAVHFHTDTHAHTQNLIALFPDRLLAACAPITITTA